MTCPRHRSRIVIFATTLVVLSWTCASSALVSRHADSCSSDDLLDATRIQQTRRLAKRSVVVQAMSNYASRLAKHVIDRPIYLELFVVVDAKMHEHYGDNLANHVRTLLFLVCVISLIY